MRSSEIQVQQIKTRQSNSLTGVRHEADARSRVGRRPRQVDQLLFGPVRRKTERRQARLCQVDARRSAYELRNLNARQCGRPRSSRHQVETGEELQEVYGRLRNAGSA